MNRTRVAFFDVDGTLTTSGSMFRLLAYYLAAMGRPPRVYEERRRELKAMAAIGCPREATNRAYFAGLQGVDAAVLDGVADRWFAAELSTGGYYHPPALAALRAHQERGDHVVIVSGSFPAPLRPIAADLGVEEVWCTQPELAHGRYTGELTGPPMIGAAKAEAVAHVLARRGAEPADCVAYGDHISDLPMLKAVGSAVVVGGDERLRTSARVHGWPLLPGTLPPPELPLPRTPDASASRTRPTFNSPYSSFAQSSTARYEMPETA
ncbi:HAD family hydrolase [Streptomyces sp. NPDC005890]|uniref:HAD family hydrolase n=1 Tax=Streptomyces sp. NPDC005890 TaxID=3154568 RepID=UPI0033C32C00